MFWLINKINDIVNKKYLELGIYDGNNFNAVLAKVKHSVDITTIGKPTFNMSTDEFFSVCQGEATYDIVYIDACHNYINVWKDYNNAVARLSKYGVIFAHDFIPKTEEGTSPWQCGDAYKFLAALMDITPEITYYAADDIADLQGLTIICNPRHVEYMPNAYANMSYGTFLQKIQYIRRYSVSELGVISKSLCQGR